MRKITLFAYILTLSIAISGCGTDEVDVYPDMEIENSDDSVDAVSNEEAEEAFLSVLDACADVWPGTAGSSLRSAAAAGQLIDWCETYGEFMDEEWIEGAIETWADGAGETEILNLQDAWADVSGEAEEMAVDPESWAGGLEDAGYELQYDEYDPENVAEIAEVVKNWLNTWGLRYSVFEN